jgi:hypothetical protein
VKTSITLSASEAKALLDTGRVTVLRLLSPQPTQDLRPLVEAITGEVWWGHDVGERAPDRGVIEYEDGTLRSVSPGRVKTWRCPWKGELAVREPFAYRPAAVARDGFNGAAVVYRADTEATWERLYPGRACPDFQLRWQSSASMPLWASRCRVRLESVEARRDEAGWRWRLTLVRINATECPTRAPAARGAPEDASILSGCSGTAGGRQDVKKETSS